LKRSYSSGRGVQEVEGDSSMSTMSSIGAATVHDFNMIPTKKRKIDKVIIDDEISPLIDVVPMTDSSHFFVPSVIDSKNFMATIRSDDEGDRNTPTDDKRGQAKAFALKLQEFDSMQQQPSPLFRDELFIEQTMAFLAQQKQFCELGKDSHVTLAYHYTDKINFSTINSRGLMPSDKNDLAIGGSDFGSGLYLSTRPDGLSFRGNVGIVVAFVKGNSARVGPKGVTDKKDIDTAVGNKKLRDYRVRDVDAPVYLDETVVKQGTQCLPLLAFPADGVQRDDWADLGICCNALQMLVDTHFNN
jgi:hypothetical protein